MQVMCCALNSQDADEDKHQSVRAKKEDRSAVEQISWGLTAPQRRALHCSQKLLETTVEVLQSYDELLSVEQIVDESKRKMSLGRPAIYRALLPSPVRDLKGRLEFAKEAEKTAEEAKKSAGEFKTVEQRAYNLKWPCWKLRDMCLELELEIPRAVREAEFWRSGPQEARETALRLLDDLEDATSLMKGGGGFLRPYTVDLFNRPLMTAIEQAKNAIEVAAQVKHSLILLLQRVHEEKFENILGSPPKPMKDPVSGLPFGDQIQVLTDRIWAADEMENQEERASVVERSFWELCALYEIVHRELSRANEEAVAWQKIAREAAELERI
ncbi:hypothetical protein KFL_000780340 [Klebsormidium nitens]|uniref:Uncharacterized protein n=1 Tax=Klebsormidium nitens TaxID=105231 RepID=A0A1Y1HU55_KLENI|nr:hypothetical protein KFL_000780340 [Klebsormidium nitens]|eukprot:GAQ81372.1 hypothetical protein KFL_000780340 [Klebsormidium nitens]